MSSARPSWTGIIQFGLLPVAVHLIAACPEIDTPLVTVHAADMGTLSRLQVCKTCHKPVSAEDTAHAVSCGNGGFAMVTKQELAALETPKVVQIDQFPPAAKIRPIYYEKTYYVQPASEDARRPYNLLRRTLEITGRTGIGKIAFRGKQRIAAIAIDENSLVLYVLRMPSEIRQLAEEARLPIDSDELKAAEQLVEVTNDKAHISRSQVPDLDRYCDDYSAGLDAIAKSKSAIPAISTNADVTKLLKKSAATARRTVVRASKKAA